MIPFFSISIFSMTFFFFVGELVDIDLGLEIEDHLLKKEDVQHQMKEDLHLKIEDLGPGINYLT